MACSPNGQLLVSGSDDGTLRVWNTAYWTCVRVLEGHTAGICSVAFSFDGQLVASGSEDRTVRVWDVNSGNCLYILEGHSGIVRSVVFSPSGEQLASGSYDTTVWIWDMGWISAFLALILSQKRPLGAELYSLIFSDFL
jgi:WD40 repeat protein